MSVHNLENAPLGLCLSKQPDSSLWVYLSNYLDFVRFLRSNLQIPESWLLSHPKNYQDGLHFEMRNWNDVQPHFFTVSLIHSVLESLSPLLDESRIYSPDEQILSEWETVILRLGGGLYRVYWHSYYLKSLCWISLICITRFGLRWVWWLDWNFTCLGWIISWSMCRYVYSIDIELLKDAFPNVPYGIRARQCDFMSSLPYLQSPHLSDWSD